MSSVEYATPWLSGVDIDIRDDKSREAPINAATQAARNGPGFSLDRAEAERLVDQASRVRDDLQQLQIYTEYLEYMRPPAADPASKSYNATVTGNGGSPGAFVYGSRHIRLEVLYLTELISRLNTALGRIGDSDRDATGRFPGVGSESKGGGLG